MALTKRLMILDTIFTMPRLQDYIQLSSLESAGNVNCLIRNGFFDKKDKNVLVRIPGFSRIQEEYWYVTSFYDSKRIFSIL